MFLLIIIEIGNLHQQIPHSLYRMGWTSPTLCVVCKY